MMIWEMGLDRSQRWAIAWGIAGAIAIGASGCVGELPGSTVPSVTIAELEQTLTGQDTTASPEVTAITGEVVAQAPLVDAGLYRVDDGTGTFWIRTENLPLPAVGDRIKVIFVPQYRPIQVETQAFDQGFGLEQQRSPIEKE